MKNLLKNSVFLFLSFGMLMSCSSDDDAVDDNPILQTDPPIILDCNYFNEDRILTKNPNAAVDYIITCVMAATADIKIEPGVVIEFEENAGIYVDDFNVPKASLAAKGTDEKPIIMRGVVKTKGFWKGILFDTGSTKNELDNVQISHAGGASFNSNNNKGAVILWADSKLKIKNSIISKSLSYGLNASYSNSILTLENNVFEDNDAPVVIHPQYINAINSTNDYTGNNKNTVFIESGSFDTPTTWKKVNVHYTILNRSVYNYSGGIDVYNLLTIEPGAIMEFDASTKLSIEELGGGIKAIGTTADPIIFTGVNKIQNGWIGIYFNSAHPANEIAFSEFHYSGKTTGTTPSKKGTIRMWYNNLLHIHDVTFKNIEGCAINYGILPGQGNNPNIIIENVTVDAGACVQSTF